MKWTTIALIICLLMACALLPTPPSPTVPLASSRLATLTPKPSVTPIPPPTRRVAATTPQPADTATAPLPTPRPFQKYYIDYLRTLHYGAGEVKNKGIFGSNDFFTRYSIQYPSETLQIAGFMNVPNGPGPYPVIIVLHGYSNPDEYNTLDYTTDTADDLATKGYIVVKPNLRNFIPSDKGDAMFRAGYAIDVLNLIALIRENAGKPGLFQKANPDRIGLWAHSMGGEIALKVAVISRDIKAIVLYAPMSGNEKTDSTFFNLTLGGKDLQTEMTASDADFQALSPETYYKDITAAIQIHHGTGDTVIPVTSSEHTCQKLKDAGVNTTCYYYDGAQHTFKGSYMPEYSSHVDAFFTLYLKK